MNLSSPFFINNYYKLIGNCFSIFSVGFQESESKTNPAPNPDPDPVSSLNAKSSNDQVLSNTDDVVKNIDQEPVKNVTSPERKLGSFFNPKPCKELVKGKMVNLMKGSEGENIQYQAVVAPAKRKYRKRNSKKKVVEKLPKEEAIDSTSIWKSFKKDLNVLICGNDFGLPSLIADIKQSHFKSRLFDKYYIGNVPEEKRIDPRDLDKFLNIL